MKEFVFFEAVFGSLACQKSGLGKKIGRKVLKKIDFVNTDEWSLLLFLWQQFLAYITIAMQAKTLFFDLFNRDVFKENKPQTICFGLRVKSDQQMFQNVILKVAIFHSIKRSCNFWFLWNKSHTVVRPKSEHSQLDWFARVESCSLRSIWRV